jgi:hypothetical protein
MKAWAQKDFSKENKENRTKAVSALPIFLSIKMFRWISV